MAIVEINTKDVNFSLIDLYDQAAENSGLETEFGQYDCRKITVSEAVQDALISVYENKGFDRLSINMMLLMSGPKVSHDLTGDTAETEHDFVQFDYPPTKPADMIGPVFGKYYDKYNISPETNIDYKRDPLCIMTSVNNENCFFRLTWSSEYCETSGFNYLDYIIYDSSLNEIDGGLIEVPERVDNLVDALDYARRRNCDDIKKFASSLRTVWTLVDEEAVSYVAEHMDEF